MVREDGVSNGVVILKVRSNVYRLGNLSWQGGRNVCKNGNRNYVGIFFEIIRLSRKVKVHGDMFSIRINTNGNRKKVKVKTVFLKKGIKVDSFDD